MNLNQLETFVHVAEHGSFSKAALVLGVAQPALSRQVRALEVELREPLRLRAKYPLVMPEHGHTFRKLMESAAALAGVQLRIEWEVSSVPAILDLVSAGIGHAALAEDAIRPYPNLRRLAVTPIVQPGIKLTLCLVTPALRRATP